MYTPLTFSNIRESYERLVIRRCIKSKRQRDQTSHQYLAICAVEPLICYNSCPVVCVLQNPK